MNIVYPVRSRPRSSHEDMLLRYSLRSIEKYASGVDKVFMIGSRRGWFSENIQVCDLSSVEKDRGNKFSGVTAKLNIFCEAGVPFVLMNDDFILTDFMDLNESQWHFAGSVGDLLKAQKPEMYKKMITNTMESFGISEDAKSLMTHTPFTVDKPHLVLDFARKNIGRHYSFRQAYAHLRKVEKESLAKDIKTDVKVYGKRSASDWSNIINNAKFISVSEDATDRNLITKLSEIFNKKSRYENGEIYE